MFNTMQLGQKMTDEEFKAVEDELRVRLFELQMECKKHSLSVIINISGLMGSGRGEVINFLSSWLDAKQIQVHTFWQITDEAKQRPEQWKYWVKLPAYGEFGIFLGGWYSEPIRKASYGKIDKNELISIMERNRAFEETLAENDYAIIKFWLHLDKEEHKKKIKEFKKVKGEYHFTPYEEKSEKKYKDLVQVVSDIIPMTDRDFSPWYIVDAYDKEFRNYSIIKALIQSIEYALSVKKKKAENNVIEEEQKNNYITPILDTVDFSKILTKEAYSKELKELKNEIFKLTYQAYKKKISSTLVFEGWDAAGKGGAIRRLAASIDSRITRIIPISSPTDEELAHHYLWRFWRHVPMCGHVTVYDRSWYGRVLVERVEHLAKPKDWKRAYSEINHFEKELMGKKHILLKFWLHISQEEQLTRFHERENIEWKNYKITPDDWRNREKADEYKLAADEMFMRTGTNYAPWHIISAESKYYARIEVLKTYKKSLEKALNE